MRQKETVDDVVDALLSLHDLCKEGVLTPTARDFYDYAVRLRAAIGRERKVTYGLLDKCHSFVFDMWHHNRCKEDVGHPLLQLLRRRLKNYWRKDEKPKRRKRASRGAAKRLGAV